MPENEQPSVDARGDNGLTQAARTLLTELQWIMLGDEATPDPDAMAAIYAALGRFRAAERERCKKIARGGARYVRGNDIKFVPPDKYAADLADDIADAIESGSAP